MDPNEGWVRAPISITARHVTLSAELEELVRDSTDRLDALFTQLLRCRVIIGGPQVSRPTNGGETGYYVRIEMRTPDGTFSVEERTPDDVEQAVRTAFENARYRLERQVKDLAGDPQPATQTTPSWRNII